MTSVTIAKIYYIRVPLVLILVLFRLGRTGDKFYLLYCVNIRELISINNTA